MIRASLLALLLLAPGCVALCPVDHEASARNLDDAAQALDVMLEVPAELRNSPKFTAALDKARELMRIEAATQRLEEAPK